MTGHKNENYTPLLIKGKKCNFMPFPKQKNGEWQNVAKVAIFLVFAHHKLRLSGEHIESQSVDLLRYFFQ